MRSEFARIMLRAISTVAGAMSAKVCAERGGLASPRVVMDGRRRRLEVAEVRVSDRRDELLRGTMPSRLSELSRGEDCVAVASWSAREETLTSKRFSLDVADLCLKEEELVEGSGSVSEEEAMAPIAERGAGLVIGATK